MENFCIGCYSCIKPCGKEEGELMLYKTIDNSREYVYYSVIEDVIITLCVRLEKRSPYLILIGEV